MNQHFALDVQRYSNSVFYEVKLFLNIGLRGNESEAQCEVRIRRQKRWPDGQTLAAWIQVLFNALWISGSSVTSTLQCKYKEHLPTSKSQSKLYLFINFYYQYCLFSIHMYLLKLIVRHNCQFPKNWLSYYWDVNNNSLYVFEYLKHIEDCRV